MNSLFKKTELFVKSELKNTEAGHNWFHVERVLKNALEIAKEEKEIDSAVIMLASLLHDIADSKFHNGDETIGPKKAKTFLENQNLNDSTINHVVKIIENISYKGGNFEQKFHSKELDIVRDADNLDALGAIGIARAFNYGGFKNREIYNPEISPKLNMTPEEYKSSEAPTINHFYEKLLLLRDKMNTKTGKKLAENRHQFLEKFLEQFYDEWEGKK